MAWAVSTCAERRLRYVLAAEKLPYAVEVFPWGHGFLRWFADLSVTANRDEKARVMAESVRRYKAEHPADPVFLVAKSGGSGVVVKALEQLLEQQVDRAVLLAPALSPGYDLSCALRAVRCDLVVFWSPLDVMMLGLGTRIFGTVDRVNTFGAGLLGFHVPQHGQTRTKTSLRATTSCADPLASADGRHRSSGRSLRNG